MVVSETRYPEEILSEDDDNGTMPDNVADLSALVVGHRIISAKEEQVKSRWYGTKEALVLTLDNGRRVTLMDTDDCCAYTALQGFFLDPSAVDHMILGVGTTDGYTTWHIYADFGDVMRLEVGWSPGNPFYYGYGFEITVEEIEEEPRP